MQVVVDRVLSDNYMYYIIDRASREAFVVDLGDISKVSEIARREEFHLKGALVTHHHWDHSAGTAELHKRYPDIKIYGQDASRIPGLTDEVKDNQVIQWNNIEIRCISTPGHTTSHTCYYVTDRTHEPMSALFTGDTIFLAGCGRFFECPASVMYDTIYNRLLKIVDDDTDMYSGHEYSADNLNFAKHVEPDNAHIKEKIEFCLAQDRHSLPSCPSKWVEEKLYNPFLRVNEATVQSFTGETEPIKVLDKLRSAKNNFKG